MNKTGTSSLHAAFGILGFRSLHRAGFARASIERAIAENRPLLSHIDEYDCYTDAPFYRYYRGLDAQYPGSRFILNTRNTADWVRSRIAHDRRWNARKRAPHEAARTCDRARLTGLKERTEKEIRHYFSDAPDRFLEMDVCAGDGWETLCGFLGLPVPLEQNGETRAFPFENRTIMKA